MRSALDQVARILTGNEDADASQVPWNRLRYEHMTALRSRLADAYAPATANKMLAAVRGVLRNAWQVGTMDTVHCLHRVPVVGSPRTQRHLKRPSFLNPSNLERRKPPVWSRASGDLSVCTPCSLFLYLIPFSLISYPGMPQPL